MNITVYAVAVEDDSSGMVYVYDTLAQAHAAFDRDRMEFPQSEVNLFEVVVPDSYNTTDLVREADLIMWQRDYVPLRWRPGPLHTARVTHNVPPDCTPGGRQLAL